MLKVFQCLAGFAIASTLGSWLALAFVGTGLPWSQAVRTWWEIASRLVSQGGWHWVSIGGAACATVAVCGGGLSWIARRGVNPAESFEGYERPMKTSALTAEVARRVERCLSERGGGVVQAFDEILRGAVAAAASDVHFSPSPLGYRITIRVSGTLHEVVNLPPDWAERFAIRVKVLARLETHVQRRPQDGRLVTQVDGISVEARVSTLPTEAGERLVLRLVRGSLGVPNVSALGFPDHILSGLRQLLAKPEGILFVTGPVGSGKTTTLYSSLQYVAASRGSTTNVVTLEDPVEIQLPFATQTQMHHRSGRTFASTLRSVLRQDPNVLMVGEIRDQETADIAVQAGLTGHLILTTLHADSAAGPFARLIDMGVEPFAVSSATVGCLSQRLVRTLCTACRRASEVSPVQRSLLDQLEGAAVPERVFDAPGCEYCEGEGFAGRAPLGELLVMNAEVRQAVSECKTTDEVARVARKAGMNSLLQEGLEMVGRGETSVAEVLRVAG